MPQPPASIYSAVAPIAKQYNVPDWLWEDVAYTESGFNPNAVGDNGTSFGLFQLHLGGQLPASYNSNPTAVQDPTLNAKLAMPALSAAWKQFGQSYNPSLQWWQQFAAASGHPGGTPGDTATQAEAQRLLSAAGGSGSAASSSAGTTGLDFWSSIGSFFSGLTGTKVPTISNDLLLRVGLVIGGSALILIGAYGLVGSSAAVQETVATGVKAATA